MAFLRLSHIYYLRLKNELGDVSIEKTNDEKSMEMQILPHCNVNTFKMLRFSSFNINFM